MQAATIDVFEEVDRQLLQLARAATAPVAAEPPRDAVPIVTAPPPATVEPIEVVWLPPPPARPANAFVTAGAIVAVLGLGVIAAFNIAHLLDGQRPLTGKAALDSVVTRIFAAESRGAVDQANKRSSAAGPAQFLDDTWLELIRAYRPDLAKGRTRDEVLALRRKPGLAREITMRFAERNAALLERRGLPVTAGTLYLAHFAGPAGAAALLEAPADADAATVMAAADASGRTKRERLVKANPFLDKFTVADIRHWARRKMSGPELVLSELVSATSRK
jgi:hypothetical protein